MAPDRDRLLPNRPPGWPAWSVSLTVHAVLFAMLLYALRHQPVRGAAEQPLRDVGIVLKQRTDDGPLFEGEEDQVRPEEETVAEASVGERLLDALPTESEIPPLDAALSDVSTLGLRDFQPRELGDATAMTGGGAPSKAIGGKTTVRVFGIEGTGSKFVYLFDRSISMQGAPLRTAKSQLIASFDALESVHQFQIIFFNHEPQVWDLTGGQQRIAFATDANKRLAQRFVDGISASGGTYRRAALRLALGLRPDVIFFLTDADDPMPVHDVADAVRRADRNAVAINTIEFGIGAAAVKENFLIKLARKTQGKYTYVDTQQLGR